MTHRSHSLPSLCWRLTAHASIGMVLSIPLLAFNAPHQGEDGSRSLALVTRQDPAPDEKPESEKKLKEWPKPDSTQEVKNQVARLRQDRSKEAAGQAHEWLVNQGDGCAPPLIRALGHEKDKRARGRIESVLSEILDSRHTQLLSPYFKDKSEVIRTWALGIASRTPDPELRAATLAAWKRILAKKDKATPSERFAAGLCMLSVGEGDGFEAVFDMAQNEWKDHALQIRGVLRNLTSPDLDRRILERLQSSQRSEQSTALRLLAAGGSPQTLPKVAPFLDSGHPTLRIDAINACRVLVDGEEPLAKIPVFQAIELAKKWKERL